MTASERPRQLSSHSNTDANESIMGLTIHWSFQGPPLKADAEAVMVQMRQRRWTCRSSRSARSFIFRGRRPSSTGNTTTSLAGSGRSGPGQHG